MVFDLYTIGAGDVIVNGLNSVALLVKQKSYTDIIVACALIGLAWATLSAAIGEKTIMQVLKDMMKVSLVLGIMVSPTAKVVVYDRAYSGASQSLPVGYVDNVPLGLATFASLSVVGHTLTDLFEAAFQRPVLGSLKGDEDIKTQGMDYLSQYSKYGMVFGSKLINATSKAKVQDAAFATDINSYVRECIIYDLKVGKRLKMGQVKESTNLLGLITGQTGSYTPNKTVTVHMRKDYSTDEEKAAQIEKKSNDDIKHFMSCDTAGTIIYNHFTKEEEKIKQSVAGFLFPSLTTESANEVLTNAFTANTQSLKGMARSISNESTSLLKQNMIINAFKSGVSSFTNQGLISSNAYMQARSQMQTRKAYESVFTQAERWLPILRAVLEILLYCMYPLMIMMMVLPNGLNVGGMFFKLFFWLQLWAPTYALINFVMSFHGMLYLKAASKLPNGSQALTLMNQADIMSTAQDTALMAGTLIGMIPLLTFFLASKSMPIMGNIGASMLGIPQSTASTAAAEVSTGQISLGNTSTDNHSADNINDNKLSDSVVMDTGMVQNRDVQGNIRTMTGAGANTLQVDRGVSNLASNLISNDNLSSQLSKTGDKLQSFSESERASADEAKAHGWSHSIQAMGRMGITERSADSFSSEVANSKDWALNKVMGVAENLAQNSTLTKEEALQTTIGLSVPNALSIIGLNAGTNINTKLAGTEAESIAKQASENEEFRHALNILERSFEHKSFSTDDVVGNEHIDQASSAFNKSHTLLQSSAKHHDDAQKYAEMSSVIKGKSFNVASNVNDDAMDYGVQTMGVTKDEIFSDKNLQRDVLQNYVDNKLMQDPEIAANALRINDIKDNTNLESYRASVANDERFNPSAIENEHQLASNDITSSYHDAVQNKGIDNSHLKDEVSIKIGDSRKAINDGRNELIEKKKMLQGEESEMSKGKSFNDNLMQGKYGDVKNISAAPSWSKDLKNNNSNQSSNS